MATAAPKAIKAFVTTVVKDQLLESNTDCSNNVETPFQALFRMELIQRGVMVSVKDEDIASWDASKTLDVVRSTAGKAILDEGGSVPVPLLAASAAVAGRVAELCASLSVPTTFDGPLLKSTLDRCKEVQDERFRVILELFVNKQTEDGPTSQQILLQMAEGYFLRGAHFQPGTPPMWKKAYDVTLMQHNATEENESPGDAAYALSNMARIAASNGNNKRATELTVRLVEAYLQLFKDNRSEKDETAISKAFVKPYKPATKNPLEKAEAAMRDCQSHSDLLSTEERFVVHVLDVEMQLAKEDARIEEEAQYQYQQAQNRTEEKPKGKTTSTKTGKQPTLSVIRDKTRDQVLRDDTTGFSDTSMNKLRDAYLERRSRGKIATKRERSGAFLLVQVLDRSRDKAKALSKSQMKSTMQGWSQLGGFLLPFLNFMQSACPNYNDKTNIETWIESLTHEETELMNTSTKMLSCLEWMGSSSEIENRIPRAFLPLIQQALSVLVDQAVKAKRDYQASSNVLKSSTEPLDLKVRELECALASIEALLLLQTSKRVDMKPYVEHAISMAQQAEKHQPFFALYGTAFYHLILAWSGLEQTPWSFCTAPEARLIQKHAEQCITEAKQEWGRPTAPVEQFILDLAQADLECGILSGGFPSVASKLYNSVLKGLETSATGMRDAFQSLLKSHCWIGLARIVLFDDKLPAQEAASEKYAQRSLNELVCLSLEKEIPLTYPWTAPGATAFFIKLHLSTSRQLVADSLVRAGRPQEAKQFLEDAVRDSPNDAEAAFSLGGFFLRQALCAVGQAPGSFNLAKMQLLKAAKLDSYKAGPFALLGVWYENQNDLMRALGCYSKALLLSPDHPVAGRGVLRLTASVDSAKSVIENAINISSPVNGWAWRAVGKQKVMFEGQNDLGAVALLKALRCRDIDRPQNEPMSVFFQKASAVPEGRDNYLGREKAEAWAELAFCYRRLGRYTAAIRGYHSSIESAGENVSAAVLCSCAEAELGLGLVEEAAEKYSRALEISGPSTKAIAAYGQGCALLSLARRDAQDGKAGAAYLYIQRALGGFSESENTFGCTQKLLGDLYSFGASLPPDVFGDDSMDGSSPMEKQAAFVKRGETCYRVAIGHSDGISASKDEDSVLRAALITDTGANILLQAQLTGFHRCSGLGYTSIVQAGSKFPEVKLLYEKAQGEFRHAIEQSPIYPPAWCGLGCAVLAEDPLLAQHAFCRSIQLDSMAPDAYANLGFLYTAHDSFAASNSVMDTLTQVADSPMMWINRALVLERNAANDIKEGAHESAEEAISQAADAYRAALQVVKHPSAMLGLALTSRMSASNDTKQNPLSSTQGRLAFQESYGYLLEYEGASGSSDASVSLLESLWTLERTANASLIENSDISFADGKRKANECIETLSEIYDHVMSANVNRNDSCLDLELIRKFLTSDESTCLEEDEKITEPLMGVTLARRIVHDPSRGDLWVELAKELCKDIGKSRTALESARLAASRAVDILTHQVTHPKKIGYQSSPWEVSSGALSEALSLVHWLNNLYAQEEKRENCSVVCVFELQKALMVDPGNRFAREALMASQSTV